MTTTVRRRSLAAATSVFAAAVALAGAASPAAAAGIPTVVPAKASNCGYTIKATKHSCDTARSLVWAYKMKTGDYTRPKYVTGVYSANSGREYDFKCSGKATVTCKTSKGKVTFKWGAIPEEEYCGDDAAGHSVLAWLNAQCGFALNTAQAYLDAPATYLPAVVDPNDGQAYPMTCFTSVDTDMLCVNNADVVVVRA